MHVEPPKKSFRPSRPNDTEPSEEQANFASKNITILPDELLVKIFSNLDTRDLVNCQLVNRRWQELIDRDHMLALAFYRCCHPAKQRISPLTVERYHSSIQSWLRGFSNLGRESAARLDKFLQHKHFTEILFFTIAKVLAKAEALTCQNVGTITHSNWVDKASFSPDGKCLVTASFNNAAEIWELVDGQWQKKTTLQHSVWVKHAFFSPDGRHLMTISNIAKIWELEGGQWQTKAILRHYSEVARACFSPDGNHLVTIANNGTAKIWGLIADQWEKAAIKYYEYGYAGRTTEKPWWVFDVCFSPDGNYLVIAAADTPTIWELVDGEWKQSGALKHCSPVSKVSFSPDGNHLVTTSGDIAKIWEAVDDRWLEKATIQHSGSITIASFSPDGSHLVTTASNDCAVKIWGLEGGHWQEKKPSSTLDWCKMPASAPMEIT